MPAVLEIFRGVLSLISDAVAFLPFVQDGKTTDRRVLQQSELLLLMLLAPMRLARVSFRIQRTTCTLGGLGLIFKQLKTALLTR